MGEDNNSTNNTDNTNNSKQSNDIGRKPIKYEAMNFEDIIENISDNEVIDYVKTGKYINLTDDFLVKFKNILDNNKNENLVEFAVDTKVKSVPEKMVYVFQDSRYHKYVDTNANKFNYYNILNSYILLINR